MADQQEEEVKEFIEKGSVKFDETDETDELIEPEKDTQSPSSEDDKSALDEKALEAEETKRGTLTIDEPKIEPKEVDGETPRERALRKEVERLKGIRRAERGSEIFKSESKVEEKQPDDVDQILERYDQAELKNLEEVIDVLAKKKGGVRNDELRATSYQQTATDILDQFLAEHSEYLPENDNDNLLWNQFKAEFSLYKSPENPREYKRIFNKVHKEIFGLRQLVDDPQLKAKDEKIKSASHAGVAKRTLAGKTPSSTLNPTFKPYLKGFSEEELEEMFGG